LRFIEKEYGGGTNKKALAFTCGMRNAEIRKKAYLLNFRTPHFERTTRVKTQLWQICHNKKTKRKEFL